MNEKKSIKDHLNDLIIQIVHTLKERWWCVIVFVFLFYGLTIFYKGITAGVYLTDTNTFLYPITKIIAWAKNLKEIIEQFSSTKSILGVCLGHQAIAECFGAKLKNLEDVMHGVSSEIIFTKEESIFKNIPNQIKVGHYHSWVINEKTMPNCFEVTSKNEDGMIMSIKHKEYDLKGVQFHPESILTQHGLLMIKNWIFS